MTEKSLAHIKERENIVMTNETKTAVLEVIDTIRKDIEKLNFDNISNEDEKELAHMLLDLDIFVLKLRRKTI